MFSPNLGPAPGLDHCRYVYLILMRLAAVFSFYSRLTEPFLIQICLVFLPALFSGRLFDLGIFKIPYVAASALLVVSTFLVAECTQYWQFVLCQGLATGVSIGSSSLLIFSS